nr:hypothetical protein [Tanacetum cinerariifolium]
MSSDNAQFAITYTSISSDSDGPSWGIPLMNASEFPEMDPYEEVAQQGQVHPLSPAYVTDLMELDKHMPVHVLEPEQPEYHEPSDEDIQDPEEDPNEEHEPENSDETEPLEEDETATTPQPPRHRGARISVRSQTPVDASTQALIDAIAAGSSLFLLPPTSPAYDRTPLGHRVAMIRMREDILEEDMPPQGRFTFTAPPLGSDIAESSATATAKAPRSQYDFVNTVEAGQGSVHSPGYDAWTIARAADRAEDIGYVKALQAFEQRMMTFIEEVNLRVSYQAQVRRQEKLQEVHQAYLSFEACNRALLARLETLETHISRMKWQRQSAKDLAVTQMMRIHTLETRARTDTVEDASSSC